MTESLSPTLPTVLLGLAGGFVFAALWEYLTIHLLKIGRLAHVRGYHLHHSLFGPGALLFVPLFREDLGQVLLIVSFGAGVVTQHIISGDGFSLITRSESPRSAAVSPPGGREKPQRKSRSPTT